MGWQREVVDVACEYDPDTGIPYYREVIVSVPRQNGKTSLLLAVELHRALFWGTPQLILYGSTDENASSKKLERDQWPIIEASSLVASVTRFIRAAGKQAIFFKSGSRLELYGRSESAAHGRSINLAVADECWADTDDRRDQAIVPAQAAVADAQFWIISTAGTEASLYLRRKVEAGRGAALNGRTSSVAYFEWSATDEDDPGSPYVWDACMPALGHTITEAVVQQAFDTMDPAEFSRAFLNVWGSSTERVISAEAWDQVCKDVQLSGSIVLGVDRNPSGTMAAIAACDRTGRAELGHYGAGSAGWVVPRLIELAKKHNAPVVLDPVTCGSFVAELERANVTVITVDGRSYATACQTLLDGIGDQRITVRTNAIVDALDVAVASARKRPIGTDGWGWARKDNASDISPLCALTVAYFVATTTTDTPREYRILSLAP